MYLDNPDSCLKIIAGIIKVLLVITKQFLLTILFLISNCWSMLTIEEPKQKWNKDWNFSQYIQGFIVQQTKETKTIDNRIWHNNRIWVKCNKISTK